MGGTLKLAGALGLLLIAGAFLLAAPAEGAGVLLHEAPSQRCPTALSRRSGVPVQLMLRGGDDEDEDGDEEGEGGGDGEEESDGVMTPAKALKQVLYFANIHDGVLRGVKEVRHHQPHNRSLPCNPPTSRAKSPEQHNHYCVSERRPAGSALHRRSSSPWSAARRSL